MTLNITIPVKIGQASSHQPGAGPVHRFGDDAVMHNRIKELRVASGLTLEQVAERTGTTAQQVSRLEKGERKLTTDCMVRLAPALNVDAAALMSAGPEAQPPALTEDPRGQSSRETINNSATYHVMEYDVGAAAGGGREPPILNGDATTPILAEWSMPADMIRAHTTPNARLAVVRVEGDSMEPDYLSGDRVLVDLSRRMPTPPGVFVVWDGLGLVLKRLELVIGAAPRKVRLSSINPAYLPYEVAHQELHISGRVIGKWMWR